MTAVCIREGKPDIVVIAIDTLRPDHLGCYGYRRQTSPAIDALAAESVVFDTAIAAGIPTTPSFTTLLTGLHPYRHRILTHPAKRRLPTDIVLLPELAKRAGYATVACDNMVVQGGGQGTWFARGYDDYSGFSYRPFGDQSSQLTDRALRFIRNPRDRPLFLFVHYWDPHTPYGPRPPYDTMHYEPGDGAVDLAEVRAIHPEYYDAFLADMKLKHRDDYSYVVAQYDGEISQADAQLGRLIQGLAEHERWDDTIVVVVSDHGECFGEGNFYFDHHGLYDAVTRLALILRIPGLPAGRCDALVSHEDVLPTLAELAGFDPPCYPLTGHSLRPLLDGMGADSDTQFTHSARSQVISVESTRQASRALRTERYKLIVPVTEDAAGEPLPDFYGRPRCPEPLLFDLTADPDERRNIAEEAPALVAELRSELETWCARINEELGEPDPIQAQGLGLPYDRFMARRRARTPPHS